MQASCLVEVAGSRLQFVTAIQLRLIVIAADGLEPGSSLGPGRPKHFSLFLTQHFFFSLWLSDSVFCSLDLDLFLGCPYLSFVSASAFFFFRVVFHKLSFPMSRLLENVLKKLTFAVFKNVGLVWTEGQNKVTEVRF